MAEEEATMMMAMKLVLGDGTGDGNDEGLYIHAADISYDNDDDDIVDAAALEGCCKRLSMRWGARLLAKRFDLRIRPVNSFLIPIYCS